MSTFKPGWYADPFSRQIAHYYAEQKLLGHVDGDDVESICGLMQVDLRLTASERERCKRCERALAKGTEE